MKTNNVDFGKSFKFMGKDARHTIVYNCHAMDDEGYCLIEWDTSIDRNTSQSYKVETVIEHIRDGHWIVLPSESTDNSHNTENTSEDNLLDEIKAFTANSKHSVNIYNGAYEVFRSGEDMAYQCKDDEALRSVMQALSVLDSVLVDE